MFADESNTEADALRELARRIVLENVGSEEMQRYIRELMELELVELPAVCRHEAQVFRSCHIRLGPSDTAELLMRRAACLDRAH